MNWKLIANGLRMIADGIDGQSQLMEIAPGTQFSITPLEAGAPVDVAPATAAAEPKSKSQKKRLEAQKLADAQPIPQPQIPEDLKTDALEFAEKIAPHANLNPVTAPPPAADLVAPAPAMKPEELLAARQKAFINACSIDKPKIMALLQLYGVAKLSEVLATDKAELFMAEINKIASAVV